MVRYIQLTTHDGDSTYGTPSQHTEILRLDETIRNVYVNSTSFDRSQIVVDYNTGKLVYLTIDNENLDKYMERIYQELLAISMADNIQKQINRETCE